MWTSFEKYILKFHRHFFSRWNLQKFENSWKKPFSPYRNVKSSRNFRKALAALSKSIQKHIIFFSVLLFGMIFIAVFTEVYFSGIFGRQNEG